jgi:hypothetical protein
LSGGGGSAAAATVATVATTSTSTTTTATTATTTTATPADWLSDRIVPPQRATTSEIDDYLPDLIKGDLDSVRDDVRRYYEARVSFVDPFRSCVVKRSLIPLKF